MPVLVIVVVLMMMLGETRFLGSGISISAAVSDAAVLDSQGWA
jgi:hypothetical protein